MTNFVLIFLSGVFLLAVVCWRAVITWLRNGWPTKVAQLIKMKASGQHILWFPNCRVSPGFHP